MAKETFREQLRSLLKDYDRHHYDAEVCGLSESAFRELCRDMAGDLRRILQDTPLEVNPSLTPRGLARVMAKNQ